jgi:hypothetical protein
MGVSILMWILAFHNPHIDGLDQQLVLVCAHGESTSLAAATLQDLGFRGREPISSAGSPRGATPGSRCTARPKLDPRAVPGMGDPSRRRLSTGDRPARIEVVRPFPRVPLDAAPERVLVELDAEARPSGTSTTAASGENGPPAMTSSVVHREATGWVPSRTGVAAAIWRYAAVAMPKSPL